MARTFPTPDYTTTTQLNGITKRKLSTTSPGTTDSLATQGPAVTAIASKAYYLSPEAVATVGTLNAVGTASGIGWGLVPSDTNTLVPLNTDGWSISAGTFTTAVVATRDTAVTSADQTCTFTAILFRANSTATTFAQELGRQASASVTMTTTKTSFPITITVPAATFGAGDILWLEIFASTAATSTTGSTASYSTNSTTGIGITSTTCTYQINYIKTLADTETISDTLSRKVASLRSLSDTEVISDTLGKASNFPRAISDALTSVSDTLVRQYTANKSLNDTEVISDSISRKFVGSRTLADTEVISDSFLKGLIYNRKITDALSSASTTYSPVIIFEE